MTNSINSQDNANNQNIGQLLKIKEEKRKKQFKERNVKVTNCLSGRYPAKLEIFARKTLFFPVWGKQLTFLKIIFKEQFEANFLDGGA